ncbi:TonB-dependent receptor [Limibacter armeniacum]|uniref:SusC/RagA family TonB-linked outer membrane protein n=1 Tax=Limibacter armeniacum TaxID=466084 RepID=UPI002FE61B33
MNNYFKLHWLSLALVLLLTPVLAWAQERVVSGTISDEAGQPLPGVSVKVKGTTKGGITDFDGKFKLMLDANDNVLVFSYVGYLSKEIELGTQSTINLQLEIDAEQLEEVVVIGYGVQRKRDIAGSIAKVESAKLTDTPTPSFEQALQGKAAGVQIIQGSGMAGSGSVVRIRGVASVSAGGDPLYVVDGVPITQDNGSRIGFMNTNPLSTLNPNDIESVEVLKDAGSAGIYGSRGANGVILITTKRGKSGKPSINYNARVGVTSPTMMPEFMDSEDWIQMRQEAWENDGNVGPVWLPGGYSSAQSSVDERIVAINKAAAINTDWIDQMVRTGFNQEHNLSMTQGSDKFKSYVGVSYKDSKSYIEGSGFNRLTGRLNLDYAPSTFFKASLTSSFGRGLVKLVAAPWDYQWGAGLGGAMSGALPIYPIKTESGEYFVNGGNPTRVNDLLDWRTEELRSINNVNLTLTPIKNLTVQAMGGVDWSRLTEERYKPQALLGNVSHMGEAFQSPKTILNYTGTLTATYNLNLNDKHNFTFLVGTETQKALTQREGSTATDVNGAYYSSPDRGENFVETSFTDPDDEWAFFSYFGRINYTLNNRYIFQALARSDASSKFGANYRWGFFPSASAAWIVSEENFLQNNEIISLLKLRTSYGVTGNANIGSYKRFGTVSVEGDGSYGYGGFGNAIHPVRLDNPDLRWETLNNFDAGIELNFFEDRIQTEVAFYHKLSKDVIIETIPAGSSGQGENFLQNIGEIQNKGWEINLNTRNLVGEFKWSTNFNIAINENEVLDLGGLAPDQIAGGTNDTRVEVGQPVGSNFLVRYAGVDPADGLPIWIDKDGNETKTFSLDDRVFAGDVLPDFTGGLSNTFEYKGFDLDVLFTFSKGGNIYGNSDKRQGTFLSDWNVRKDVGDYWRQPGDDAKYPKPTLVGYPGVTDAWQFNSTMWLYDASFARLRNITLGYRFKPTQLAALRLQSARVYVTGTNLLTFTKYPGGDPEIARDFDNPADRNMSSNVTFLTAPQEKSIMFGLNVTF